MHFTVILNRDGGSLRTLDLDAFSTGVRETLEAAGHEAAIEIVEGSGLEASLKRAAKGNSSIVMAGGGDGTVSAAASILMGTGKALAILPAGTMNLFARSLGIPLKLDAAVAAFADGTIREVDLARANQHIFVHQFSVGLHAKLIRLREREAFASRWGKMRASARAGLAAFLRPPNLRVRLEIDGEVHTLRTSGIGVTNNLFGEGHLPYADDPAGAVLGVYVSRARRRRDLARFLANMALGRWRANDQVDIHVARKVRLEVSGGSRRFGSAIDGELHPLQDVTKLEILPGALKVLVPAAPAG